LSAERKREKHPFSMMTWPVRSASVSKSPPALRLTSLPGWRRAWRTTANCASTKRAVQPALVRVSEKKMRAQEYARAISACAGKFVKTVDCYILESNPHQVLRGGLSRQVHRNP
jgi:hypothetical protein